MTNSRFTIDAAASAENALLGRYWTLSDNAIVQEWYTPPDIIKAAVTAWAVSTLIQRRAPLRNRR